MTGDAMFDVVVIANVLVVTLGVILTALSFHAYRSDTGTGGFLETTLAFLLITIGSVLAPVYEFGFVHDYQITPDELREVQFFEGLAVTLGLAILLYSIWQHRAYSSRGSVRSTTYQIESRED